MSRGVRGYQAHERASSLSGVVLSCFAEMDKREEAAGLLTTPYSGHADTQVGMTSEAAALSDSAKSSQETRRSVDLPPEHKRAFTQLAHVSVSIHHSL